MSTDELKHYGVLGMHWGIRRYQPYPKGSKAKGKFLPGHGTMFDRQSVLLNRVNYKLEVKDKRIKRLRKKADKLNAKAEKHELKGGRLIRTEFSDDSLRKAARERAQAKRLVDKSDKLVKKGEKYVNKFLNKYDKYEKYTDAMERAGVTNDPGYLEIKDLENSIKNWSNNKKSSESAYADYVDYLIDKESKKKKHS